MRITTRDPAIDPQVDERMLSHKSDLIRMRDGVRRLVEICRHDDVKAISTRVAYGASGRSIEEPLDGTALDDWMFAECSDGQHASGTCRMGPADDPRSVVDVDCPRDRLHGAARDRRLDHAHGRARQHQPHDHHDRREDGRSAEIHLKKERPCLPPMRTIAASSS